jgi:hypothetical protein
LPILAGATRSLREDVAAGWLTTIQELIHADTFADFLDQAVELLDKGYKDAAAVLVGCVLESHLRQLCGKFKVSTKGADGKPVTADTMRTQLAKASAYNKLVSSTIAGWLALRNAAAHGNYAEYNSKQVVSALRDVRSFVESHPA